MKTKIPGTKSSELMKTAEKYVPKAVYTVTPLFVANAEGSVIEDVDGNRFIDFATGIASLNVGHRHPKVIEAISNQLDKYLHVCYHVTPYEPYVRLSEKLATAAPGQFEKKVVLLNSGAEAVENALKIAMKHTGRPKVIAFQNAFHGRTRAALGVTGNVKPYKHGFFPLETGVHRVPYAYCYRCSFGQSYPDCGMRCLQYLRERLEVSIAPDSVAAIIAEPVIGEGGFIVPPKEFLTGLREICDEHQILFIADEIQSGMGRTGRIFAIEHYDVVPDLITVAKSLGGGLPISGVVGKAEYLDSVHVGGLGGTFIGNPLSCVAGLAAMDAIHDSLEHGNMLAEILASRMDEWYEKYEVVGDVRGLGLMRAVELVKDRTTKEPAKEETARLLKMCHEKGLILLSTGPYKNVIRFLPAINMDEDLFEKALQVFESCLAAL
ncbi:aspartate aminotransferase family protein [Candidatus Thorarchaeota archaeon]|nr:MAG: aspartate aminotransferase family protein [Candidatus Thorarchaeota archaeon]